MRESFESTWRRRKMRRELAEPSDGARRLLESHFELLALCVVLVDLAESVQ